MDTTQSPARPRSMTPLYLLIAISLAPVLFALAAYYLPSLGLRPDESNAYGQLIEPQRSTPDDSALALHNLQGEAFDLQSLRGRWVLLSADESACPESCVRKLFILRNSHASQGKNVERLARVWFVTDQGQPSAQVLEAYQGTHMLRADPRQLAAFLSPEAVNKVPEQAVKNGMWIIDPNGNLMMLFPSDADPLKVRTDIRKLLTNSRIG
ncbi:MAG: SCO family protein [Alcaligenes sp.]